MKKILIIILFMFFCLPVFAEYKPIPKELSAQYKKEIEQLIKTQVPISQKNIDNVFREVEAETDEYIKMNIIEYGIESEIFYFYMKLIDVTEKYAKIKEFLPGGDSYTDLIKALNPYFKDNGIKTSKIKSFLNYSNKKQKELEKKYNYQIELD